MLANELSIKSQSFEYPVDTIIEVGDYIVIGSYNYDGGRRGKIQFLDKDHKIIQKELETSGTLCIAALDSERLVAANASDISLYELGKLKVSIETESINTCVCCTDEFVYVSNTAGSIEVFTSELVHINHFQVSSDTVWIIKSINGFIFAGTEDGRSYRIKDGKLEVFGAKRSGIINFIKIDGLLAVTSYDDNVELFDINSLELIKTVKKIGSIWNIEEYEQLLICACMYDGLKILNRSFEQIRQISTESICYGLCITKQEVFWSSFYEKKVFWMSIGAIQRNV